MKKIITFSLAILMIAGCLASFASCGNSSSKKVKVIDIALSSESYAFAISKESTELLTKTNEYLDKIAKDGTFDKICDNYFGSGEPQKIKSAVKDPAKDQLIVATSTGFEPFEMVDQNGMFSGIDMEIAAGLAEFLGKELVIEDMKFESVVTSVQSNICHIGMAGLTITPKRSAMVAFSDSYYNASQVIVAKEDDTTFDNCKTADDVVKILDTFTDKISIGCQTGTTGETYIKGDLDLGDEGYGFKGIPATKKPYDYAALAMTAMVNGEIDYVILDNAPANAISKSLNK